MTTDDVVHRVHWALPSEVTCKPTNPQFRDFATSDEATSFLRSLRSRFGEILCCVERRHHERQGPDRGVDRGPRW
jgi:hypothetical protein